MPLLHGRVAVHVVWLIAHRFISYQESTSTIKEVLYRKIPGEEVVPLICFCVKPHNEFLYFHQPNQHRSSYRNRTRDVDPVDGSREINNNARCESLIQCIMNVESLKGEDTFHAKYCFKWQWYWWPGSLFAIICRRNAAFTQWCSWQSGSGACEKQRKQAGASWRRCVAGRRTKCSSRLVCANVLALLSHVQILCHIWRAVWQTAWATHVSILLQCPVFSLEDPVS